MTTLKEIETRLIHLHDTSICTAEDCFRREHGDLLVRSVRQLGARHNAMMDVITSEYAKISFARDYAIDSDVLALLEEGR